MKRFVQEWLQEIVAVSTTLFKILIPVLLIVKLLQELGATEYLSMLLAPAMQLVGLPDAVGIVWATTLLVNIYAGMLVFANLGLFGSLSVEQVTVLCSMMLLAHGLLIEGTIAKKSGMNVWLTVLIRIGGALLYGFILHRIYQAGGWLQQPAHVLWQPVVQADPSLAQWAWGQVRNLAVIFGIICVLLFGLKLLKVLGIERLAAWLLQPVLRLLGIGPAATNISIIGITLGLSYGGGLLINEARQGTVPARDVCIAMVMLSLLHSVIEDTLLLLTLGADLSGMLWGRMLFTFIVVAIMSRLMNRLGEVRCQRWFYKVVSQSNSSSSLRP